MEFITVAKAVLKPASELAHLNPPTTSANILLLDNYQGRQYALVLTPEAQKRFQELFQSENDSGDTDVQDESDASDDAD